MAAIALPSEGVLWRPAHNPWLVALTVTLATFMEVLDTSIANVALPHIAGSLGASSSWSNIGSALPGSGWAFSQWRAFGLAVLRLLTSPCLKSWLRGSSLCGLRSVSSRMI